MNNNTQINRTEKLDKSYIPHNGTVKIPTESDLYKINFYIQSMYSHPFIVMADLSSVTDCLITCIKDWKHRRLNRKNNQKLNKQSHVSI